MGLLKRICDICDLAWEDFIYDPASLLPTLLEVANIDSKWLAYLKPLLGFTSDLSFEATEEELRRLLSQAVPFWNAKPTELGVITHPIRMVTGNRFRVRNFQDLRMAVDETVIGEECEDFDPWCEDFWGRAALDLDIWLGKESPWHEPRFGVSGGLSTPFLTSQDYRYLVVDSIETAGWDSLVGTYRIAWLNPYSDPQDGAVQLPVGTLWPCPSPAIGKGRLYGTMDEYTSEVRLVDDGIGVLNYDGLTAGAFVAGDSVAGVTSGAVGVVTLVTIDDPTSGVLGLKLITGRFVDNEVLVGTGGVAIVKGKLQGAINRPLMRFLMDVVRPLSERTRIVYVDLLDEFETPDDLDQWAVTIPVTVPSPGGAAVLGVGGRLLTTAAFSPEWGDATIYWKVALDTATSAFDGLFRYLDVNNHYRLRLDMATKKVGLIKSKSGLSLLAESAAMPWLKPGCADVIRVDVINRATVGVHFKVTFDGEPLFTAEDPTNANRYGRVGALGYAGTSNLHLIEAAVWPVETDHVGPPPAI